jgi:hypothetical protein
MIISNAASKPLFDKSGDVPDVSGALTSYYQPMVFGKVTKVTNGFQVQEKIQPLNFQGVIQPFSERQLLILPEGQRSWTWYMLHADPSLKLDTDEVVIYQGKQTRIMGRTDYSLYGYVQYKLVQDYQGSGPS